MDEPTILLIDDDMTLLELLADHLRVGGYHVIVARSGVEGLRQVESVDPDLMVLDVMMPGMDGWEVCQRVREQSALPIIMLTAKGEEVDKLRGFRLGVDDYVTKPFSFAELTARIGAVLARARHRDRNHQRLTSGNLAIDLDSHKVSIGGQPIDLTPTEYRLLILLASQSGRTIPSEVLLEEVWGPEYAGELKHVKHFIWSLRNKIEADPGDPQHILTERGFGYRFE
jgi:two-component system KDP operon response regulator KdpE